MTRALQPAFDVHRNRDGYCAHDRQAWPCPAVPCTLPGYDAARVHGETQRAGEDWLDDLPSGVQIYSRVVEQIGPIARHI